MQNLYANNAEGLREQLAFATWPAHTTGQGENRVVLFLTCPLCFAMIAVRNGFDNRKHHIDYHVDMVSLAMRR